jgi:hypothetical protein
VARQDQILEVIGAERRLRARRSSTADAGRWPWKRLQPHKLWLLLGTGLLLGHGLGVAMRYRMLPAIWYAASISMRVLPSALRRFAARN